MDSSFTESEWSDSEMTLSPPPAVIRAEDEEIMSALQNPLNNEDPKLKGKEPLDAAPLSVNLSPYPYGGKEPITSGKNKLGHLGDKSVPVRVQATCSFPQSIKSLECYKEEDWTAFLETRVTNGHKDWFYEHRVFQKKFRSKVEVEEFLRKDGPITGMFRGRRLQKRRIAGLDGHGHGQAGSTSKSTRGRKAANYATKNVPVDPKHSIKPTLPHGFV